MEWLFETKMGIELQFKGLMLFGMIGQTYSMNAEQANEVVTRIIDLSQAATTATQAINSMLQEWQGGKAKVW